LHWFNLMFLNHIIQKLRIGEPVVQDYHSIMRELC
jgi:hypothetical protein